MNNLFNYLKKYGDKTFSELEFNEVDNVIFCAFSYIKIDILLKQNKQLTISDLYKEYKIVMDNNIFHQNQDILFKMLVNSKRFRNIVIKWFINEVLDEKEMQFGAMTFEVPSNFLFVSFRGTDETITGWKEDFNMSYMKVIPAQKNAVNYLNYVLKNSKEKIIVGGHSKGGNLAFYASIFCDNTLKKKIIKVFNNDGPGLVKEIFLTEEYQKIKNKMVTYIPKASIIGNIFDNESKIILIDSFQIGIFQHDLYSWLVNDNKFKYAKEISIETKKLVNFLNESLNKIPNYKKKIIVDFLYSFISSLGIYDIEKFLQNFLTKEEVKYNLNYQDIIFLKKIIPILKKVLDSLKT